MEFNQASFTILRLCILVWHVLLSDLIHLQSRAMVACVGDVNEALRNEEEGGTGNEDYR